MAPTTPKYKPSTFFLHQLTFSLANAERHQRLVERSAPLAGILMNS